MNDTNNSIRHLQSTATPSSLRQELPSILEGLLISLLYAPQTRQCADIPNNITMAVLTTQGPHLPARVSASKGVSESPLSWWQQLLTQLKSEWHKCLEPRGQGQVHG